TVRSGSPPSRARAEDRRGEAPSAPPTCTPPPRGHRFPKHTRRVGFGGRRLHPSNPSVRRLRTLGRALSTFPDALGCPTPRALWRGRSCTVHRSPFGGGGPCCGERRSHDGGSLEHRRDVEL